ncbi:hypothetical protein F5884DRAFT_735556 [Xylogone sp. PMI_703]|nr:hypothetical protein F5884DRAFT_735556 [Xylogone sp. PMI_703]
MLVNWILDLEAQGHAPTHGQVREIAQIQYFKLRNPRVTTILGKALDLAYIKRTSLETLQGWFTLFHKTVTTHKIKPHYIYNMDETGIVLGACANQYVLEDSEKKQIYLKTPENRE